MNKREKERKKVLICSAWPYSSGVPHLGNVQTSLLSGDVFARYYRLRGEDVLYVSGSDAHGTRIEYESEKRGITPEQLAEETHERILDILDSFNIEFDNYTITTNPTHHSFVREIYRQMDENGYILNKEEERAYCNSCQKFLADRFIIGTCPNCGAEEAHGNQCDSCGTLLEPEELIEPRCAICEGSEIEFRPTRHWYLDLEKLQPRLESYVGDHFDQWQDNVCRFTRQMLEDGLEAKAITRDIEWGIPAPFPEAEDKVIYVWGEAALGYVSATKEYFELKEGLEEEDWKDFWFSEDLLHIYTHAKDNIPFHTLLFPGQLIASGQGYHLPDQISASEYLNWTDGQSFSKSKGIGLYADEATDLLDAVYWRFYLLYFRPEKRDAEFSWRQLDNAINDVFADNVSNFINRVTSFAYSRFGSQLPQGELTAEVRDKVSAVKDEVEGTIEGGTLAGALRGICGLANYGNSYFQEKKPWEDGDPDVVLSSLTLVKAISIMLEPFVPSFSQRAYSILGLERPGWEEIEEPYDGDLNEPGPLLEKPDVEELKQRYQAKKEKEANLREGEEMVAKEIKERVDFESFQSLDIRVGKIEEVEEIAGADRLYRVEVDIGGKTLTTASGLRNHYEVDQLRGKRVVALVNLEPAEIYGVRSECMLLAAVDGDDLALLTTDPERDVPPGAKVE